MLSIEIIDRADWANQLGIEWDELLQNSAWASPFQSRQWIRSWWRYFGGRRRPYIFTLREGKDLVGVMPLYESKLPFRSLLPMGRGQSDYMHPLVQNGYEEKFAQFFSEHIENLSGIDLIDLQQVREGQKVLDEISDSKLLSQENCYLLDLPSTYDEYVKTLSKSMRYEARRIMKGPYKTQEAIIERVGKNDIVSGLEALYELHGRRWRKRGLPGSFASKRVRNFHEEFCSQAIDHGMLNLSLLKFEGQPVGAIYALKVGKTYYYYQSGFDPTHKALSPGSTLVSHTIKEAIESGATQFDFMRGDEPYKARWKPQHKLSNMRLIKNLSTTRGMIGTSIKSSVTEVRKRVLARLVK